MLGQKSPRRAITLASDNHDRQMQCARAHIELEKEMQYLRLLRSANRHARMNPVFSVVQDIAVARTVFNIRCHRFTIEQLEGRAKCFGCNKVNGRLRRYNLGLLPLPDMGRTPVDLCDDCAVELQATTTFHLYEPDSRD